MKISLKSAFWEETDLDVFKANILMKFWLYLFASVFIVFHSIITGATIMILLAFFLIFITVLPIITYYRYTGRKMNGNR